LGPGPAELVASVDQQPHHDQVVVDLDPPKPRVGRGVQRGQRHRPGIDQVSLSPVAHGKHPHLRRQLGRHINHDLTVVDQPVRDVLADAVSALDRPHPTLIPTPGAKQLGVPGLVRPEPSDRHSSPGLIDDLDRGRSLVRVHPDDHAHRCAPSLNEI